MFDQPNHRSFALLVDRKGNSYLTIEKLGEHDENLVITRGVLPVIVADLATGVFAKCVGVPFGDDAPQNSKSYLFIIFSNPLLTD
jgi:hypothetical protein